MTPEVWKIMLGMGSCILPMMVIIIVRDFLHTIALDQMYKRIDELREKQYGKGEK